MADESEEQEPQRVEEPAREINMKDFVPKTLSEEEEGSSRPTDLQAILKTLTPKFSSKRLNELLQPVIVSRIFPDNYLDLNYFLSMSLIEEEADKDNGNEVDFVSIVTGVQSVTSIAYEGRGIADRLEIAGVAHEEEMEKLSKDLGIG